MFAVAASVPDLHQSNRRLKTHDRVSLRRVDDTSPCLSKVMPKITQDYARILTSAPIVAAARFNDAATAAPDDEPCGSCFAWNAP